MCVFTCALKSLFDLMQSRKSCRCAKFLDYDFQTPSQIACLNRCKVTLVACVQRNPNVILHKSSKITCLYSHNSCRCVKFLQYDFQIAYLNRCNVTLVACVWFSQMLVFMCLLKTPAWIDAKSQELQICEISPLWFQNAFSNCLIENIQLYNVTLVACMSFSKMCIFTCALKSPAWTDAKSQ